MLRVLCGATRTDGFTQSREAEHKSPIRVSVSGPVALYAATRRL